MKIFYFHVKFKPWENIHISFFPYILTFLDKYQLMVFLLTAQTNNSAFVTVVGLKRNICKTFAELCATFSRRFSRGYCLYLLHLRTGSTSHNLRAINPHDWPNDIRLFPLLRATYFLFWLNKHRPYCYLSWNYCFHQRSVNTLRTNQVCIE